MSGDGTYLGVARSPFTFTSKVAESSSSLTPEVLEALFRKLEDDLSKPPSPMLCPGCAAYGMIPVSAPLDLHWEFCVFAEIARLIDAGKEREAMKIVDQIYGPICRAMDLI